MGSVVDSTCKGCAYLVTCSFGKCCNYSIITGHSRGCHAGAECTRYDGPPRTPPKQKAHLSPEEQKKERRTAMTPEEAYEREKAKKRERAKRYRAKAQGRQRSAIAAYKAETGYSNNKIALLLGIPESRVQKWSYEYGPADWDLLAKIGIIKPEGL